jgi:IclR family KDG regulon transcriptional repressor
MVDAYERSPRENKTDGCVGHVVAVLRALRDSIGGSGVSEVARLSGLGKSGAHRILVQLEQEGFVERLDGGRYRLGVEAWRLGQGAVGLELVRSMAHPIMVELTAMTGETTHLAVLERNMVVYVATVETPSSIRAYAEIGDLAPAHAVATGKALLAKLTPAERDLVLGTGALPRYTPSTLADREQLERDLDEVVRRGYARNEGEWREEVNGVAVATVVLGRAVALGVAGPAYRFGRSQAETAVLGLVRAARDLEFACSRPAVATG